MQTFSLSDAIGRLNRRWAISFLLQVTHFSAMHMVRRVIDRPSAWPGGQARPSFVSKGRPGCLTDRTCHDASLRRKCALRGPPRFPWWSRGGGAFSDERASPRGSLYWEARHCFPKKTRGRKIDGFAEHSQRSRLRPSGMRFLPGATRNLGHAPFAGGF